METLLQNVEELVQDQDEVVTYKFLSCKFQLNVNIAKQVLYAYVQQCKKQNHPVSCMYLLGGTRTKAAGGGRVFQLVSDTNLAEKRKEFERISSEHIYSVCKAQPKDVSTAVYAADYALQRETLDSLAGLCGIVNSNVATKHSFTESTSTADVADTFDEEDPLQQAVDDHTKRYKINEGTLVKEKPSSFFTSRKKSQTRKSSNSGGGNGGNGSKKQKNKRTSVQSSAIGKAFQRQSSKPSAAPASRVFDDDEDDEEFAQPNPVKTNARARIIDSDDEDEAEEAPKQQQQEQQQEREEEDVKEEKEGGTAQVQSTADSAMDEDADETDVEDEEEGGEEKQAGREGEEREQNTTMDTHADEKSAGATNKPAAAATKKRDEEEAEQNTATGADDASTRDGDAGEADDEEDIPRTKTVRKTVRKTFRNDKGYMVSKDVEVVEEVPLTEADIAAEKERRANAKRKAQQANSSSSSSKNKQASSSSSSAAASGAKKAKKKAKQASLMSFFSKK
ncbi:hypothetical protein PTSG_11980 [Salpingoeca rosetta]|uniref:DNA polymerase delta subunit 3 n=1 Tax=Salpingoeca rosetta (strain ATCC 50818 / BSB-021) TaxID=946362 RepID=F2U4L1_SALR5|nr:uncharacterized protein PTSG_11980 [Salpingoeca rosetta]EGD82577.1 hypothetical protein PTSG_11980 [Salpingoeca rosetta]|eukprot:XP_004995813.1 hypothetical protein PTSG_11980 [Salpingoeca rosetta]